VSHLLPFLFCPLDLHPTARIKRPNPIRYQPVPCCHVAALLAPLVKPVKLNSISKFKFQFLCWSCKIDIK
jgi:hypothetical protein